MKLVTTGGKEFVLKMGKTRVGRGSANDLVINDSQLSRHHAEIHWDGQRCMVVDLGSTNGTFVNRHRIAPREPMVLKAGTELMFGSHVACRVQASEQRPGAPTVFQPEVQREMMGAAAQQARQYAQQATQLAQGMWQQAEIPQLTKGGFSEMLAAWGRIIVKPSPQLFAAEAQRADIGQALLGMIIAGAVGGLLGNLTQLIFASVLAPYGLDELVSLSLVNVIVSIILGAIGLPLGFLITSALHYVAARMLGGTGDYVSHAYCLALFQAPLYLLSIAIGLIPILGWGVAILLTVYGVVLSVQVFQVVHQLDTARAFIVWTAPIILMTLLCGCIALFGGAIMGASLMDLFSEIGYY